MNLEVEEISERFLPILEFAGDEVVITQSPLGTGKTTCIINYLKAYKPDSVLFVMFRRSLTRNIASKLKAANLEGYINYQGFRGALDKPKMLIQVESLHRLKRFKFDLVVVDEITSVLNQFSSPHHRDHLVENRQIFIQLFQNPKMALMDGFIDQRTLDFVQRVSPNSIYLLRNKFRVDYRDYRLILEHQIPHKIKDWVAQGKNVVVPCATKKFASRLAAQLRSWKITTLYFASDTNNHHLVDSINDQLRHFRVLIYTPTFQAGIDIHVERFHLMVAYGSPYSCCARDFFQMMWRVRTLIDQQVYLCIQKGTGPSVQPAQPSSEDIWEKLAYQVNLENWRSALAYSSELSSLIEQSRSD